MNKKKLAQVLRDYFQEVKAKRKLKEMEWIKSLRQYKRQYDPEILAKIRQYQGSEVYPNYTRSKVKPTIARINSIFFPVANRAWEIDIDRTAQIPQQIIAEVNQEIQAMIQQGQQPTKQDMKNLIQNRFNEVKNTVSNVIDNQLSRMKFEEVFKSVNYSAVVFGTGILKGVLTRSRTIYDTIYGENGVEQRERIIYEPYVVYVPIWNIYPDFSTFDPDKLSFVFETHKLSKKELLNLTKFDGFDESYIRKYIKETPDGDYQKPNWELELESLGDEQTQGESIIGNYLVLEYWGYVDGYFLDDTKYNPANSYMINAWVLGNNIIYLNVLDVDETPTSTYHFYYYEKDDSSIFGEGLPSILRGTQLTICGAARMMLDNATTVVGPQFEVNIDLLSPEQDITNFFPRKIWYREGRGVEAQYPAIRAVNADSHIQEYMAIIETFKKFGDEESNLPAFVWGDTDNLPANTTATGMAQLTSNTNMSIADIVRGFEKENLKLLSQLIQWNKDFNEQYQVEFSFDFIIKGFGYETEAHREAMLQALSQFNNSVSPQDEIYINKYNLYKHELKLLNLPYDDIIRSPEEVQELIAQQQDPEAIQLAKEKELADIEYTKAKATHMLAKSKDAIDKINSGG